MSNEGKVETDTVLLTHSLFKYRVFTIILKVTVWCEIDQTCPWSIICLMFKIMNVLCLLSVK